MYEELDNKNSSDKVETNYDHIEFISDATFIQSVILYITYESLKLLTSYIFWRQLTNTGKYYKKKKKIINPFLLLDLHNRFIVLKQQKQCQYGIKKHLQLNFQLRNCSIYVGSFKTLFGTSIISCTIPSENIKDDGMHIIFCNTHQLICNDR